VAIDRIAANMRTKLLNRLLTYNSILLCTIEIFIQCVSEQSNDVNSFEANQPTEDVVE
jgi:hypothetical protein